MKTTITTKTRLFLTGLIMMLALNASGQTNYNVEVGGVKVNSNNYQDITGENIKSGPGSVTYNPIHNTLTLNNAIINGDISLGDRSIFALYKIKLIGENQIYGSVFFYFDFSFGIQGVPTATIEGPGTLSISSSYSFGLFFQNHLEIKNCKIDVESKDYAINGRITTEFNSRLTITNSVLNLKAGKNVTYYLREIVFRDCNINSPIGAQLVVKDFDGGFYLNGSPVKEMEIGKYPLWIAGTQVTSLNDDGVTGAGISGTVTYDDELKTLMLNNAYISAAAPLFVAIRNEIPDLKIILVGTNALKGAQAGIQAYENVTIHGIGTLNIGMGSESVPNYGLFMKENKSITIAGGAKVSTHGRYYGVFGDGDNCSLNIYGSGGAYLKASVVAATGYASIGKINNFYTEPGTVILAPSNAVFNSSLKGIAVGGKLTIDEVHIAKGTLYPLWVGGTQVTSLNQNNITGTGITGKVSYDAGTQTLTLNGANITKSYYQENAGNEYYRGIYSTLPNLNIVVIGTNSINPNGGSYQNQLYEYGIQANKIFMKGSGTLNITTTGTCEYGLYTENCGIYDTGNRFDLAETAKVNINSAWIGLRCSGPIYCTKNTSFESYGKEAAIYHGSTGFFQPKKMEGETKATALEVEYLTIVKQVGTGYYSKPYVSATSSGTGLASLTSQGIQVRGGKGEIRIDSPLSLGRGAGGEVAYVYNVSGMLVRTLLLPLQGAGGQVSVPAGIYIVRIGNGAEKVVVR